MQITDLVWIGSLDGSTIFDVNPAVETMYGRPANEFRANPNLWLEIVHPDDRALAQASMETLRILGRAEAEYRILHPDGSVRWILDRKSLLYDEHGEAVRIGGIASDITERKQTIHALSESEELYRLTLSNMSDAVFITDPTGVFTFICPNVHILFGYSESEVAAMHNISRLLGENIFDPDELAERGEIPNIERTIIDKAGLAHIVLVTIKKVSIKQGTVLYTCHDITMRRQTEEVLQQNLVLLNTMGRIAKIGAWELDVATMKEEWTEETYAIHDRARGSYEPNATEEISKFEPGSKELIEEAFEEALKYGKPYDLEVVMITVKGNRKWVRVVCSPLMKDGKVVKLTGTVQDFTGQKQADERLREREEQYRFLLNNTSDFITRYDRNGITVFASDASLRFNGYRPDEIVNTPAWARIHPDDQERARAELERVVATGVEGRVEYRVRRKDGNFVWVEASGRRVENSVGEPEVVVVQRDITARKQAETALQAERSRAQQYLDIAGVMVVALNRRGEITLINKKGQRILGYEDESELLGANWFDTCLPRDVTDEVRTIFDELTGGDLESDYYENPVQTRDGAERLIAFHNSAVRNLEGQLTGILCSGEDITERRHAEQMLREAEDRLARVMEGSQLGYWDWNIQTGEVHRNARWAEMLGFTLEEIKFTVNQWTDLHHPDDREAVLKSIQDHLAGKTPAHRIEYRMRTKDGQYKWILDQASVVTRDADGKPLRMSGTHTDITDRKHAEKELRESEEKYRVLLESVDSAVATVDKNGTFLYMNDTAAEQLGDSPERLTGRNMVDLFPKVVADHQLTAIRSVIAADQGTTSESISSVQGTPRWYRTLIQPLHDETGQVSAALINSTDIHDLKIMQQQLEELNRSLEEKVMERTAEVLDLYDNAPTGYHSLDAQGMLVKINQTELNWLGYTRDEVIGRPYSNLLTSPSRAFFVEHYPHLEQEGSIKDMELEVACKDGTVMPVLVNATAAYDTQGNFIQSRFSIINHTEQKMAQATLRIANSEMQRAVRVKDEFLANMSHELRTPLNGILSSTEVLLSDYRGPLNARQRTLVGIIDSSGRHLLQLINDILDLSKIEAKKLELDIESVDIGDVCHASLIFVKESALKKDVSLSFVMDESLTSLRADGRRLKQILVNLLSNAVKFTPAQGAVTLAVHLDRDRRQIDFSVSDTGIGISLEDQKRLFSPFTQVDNSLTRSYEGTGLGLALVKRLVDLHGGTVAVESEVGQGSRFTISLPWHEPEPGQHASVAAENSVTGDAMLRVDDGNKFTILVVEDNSANLAAMEEYLTSKGYHSVHAADGYEALAKAAESSPDLIVMDIQMPRMDGLEATRRLRANPQFATTPIIALTAHAMIGDRERCLAAGATDYLGKPVRLEELTARIKALIHRASAST